MTPGLNGFSMTDNAFFSRSDATVLAHLADLTGSTIVAGDPDLVISGIGPIDQSHPGEITFIENPRYIKDLSGTGNSVNANIPMVSRMIRDSLEFWVQEYHIDGFRFDLLGIFDYAAVGDWGRHLNRRFPERKLLLYGEPWNGAGGGDFDDRRVDDRVRLGTIARIADAHVAAFNPKYREAIKGQNANGHGGG